MHNQKQIFLQLSPTVWYDWHSIQLYNGQKKLYNNYIMDKKVLEMHNNSNNS